MPYRIAAPPDPEPPEPEDPYAAVIRREQRRARLVALAAGAALLTVVVSVLGRPAPARAVTVDDASRVAQARGAIADARARAASEQALFERTVANALDAELVARPDLGACPITLPRPSALTRRRAFPLLTIDAKDTAELPSQAIADVLADVQRAESHVATGRYEEASLYAHALERPERLAYDVVLVASSWKKPRATSPTTHEAGTITGRAYLYDFATRQIACVADIEARSSPRIGYAYATTADAPAALGREARLAESVDDDMRAAIELAVADSMKWRAGPRR